MQGVTSSCDREKPAQVDPRLTSWSPAPMSSAPRVYAPVLVRFELGQAGCELFGMDQDLWHDGQTTIGLQLDRAFCRARCFGELHQGAPPHKVELDVTGSACPTDLPNAVAR